MRNLLAAAIRSGVTAVAIPVFILCAGQSQLSAQVTLSVKVETISMIDDSDDLSDCDCHFWANIHSQAKPVGVRLFSHARPVTLATGRTIGTAYPGTVIENPGTMVEIVVTGWDIDRSDFTLQDYLITQPGTPGTNPYADVNVAKTVFNPAEWQGEHFSKRLTLRSRPGHKLQFQVSVLIKIARRAAFAQSRAVANAIGAMGPLTTICPRRRER